MVCVLEICGLHTTHLILLTECEYSLPCLPTCPVYLKSARKVHLFGICNEGIPKQVKYLAGESQIMGKNGKMAHGPNSVISMLHHYFAKHGLGEKSCVLHDDNCAGQNKNSSVIGYLAWKCMTGLHEEIQLRSW